MIVSARRRARNGLRLVSGLARPPAGGSPRRLVWQRDGVRLYRYDSDRRAHAPPVLLVMSLVTRPSVLDLRPGNSLVERLVDDGLDVYLLDWGVPAAVDAANTLETYCDEHLPLAAAAACEVSQSDDLTLLGYCLGGVLALLFVAGHRDAPVRSLVVVATPIDFATFGPLATVLGAGRLQPEDLLDETGNLPAEAVLAGIRLLQPTADLTTSVNLWQHLHDDHFVEAHESLMGWARDHIPFPGAAFRQVVERFVRDRALVAGVVRLGDREVRLADIACPVLSVSGDHDHLVPPASSDPLAEVLTGCRFEELRVTAGHVGLLVGRQAHARTIPAMVDWILVSDAARGGGPAPARR